MIGLVGHRVRDALERVARDVQQIEVVRAHVRRPAFDLAQDAAGSVLRLTCGHELVVRDGHAETVENDDIPIVPGELHRVSDKQAEKALKLLVAGKAAT